MNQSKNLTLMFIGRVAFFLIGLAAASMIASMALLAAISGYNIGEMPAAGFILTLFAEFIAAISFLPAAFGTAVCSKQKKKTPTAFMIVGALVGAAGASMLLIGSELWAPTSFASLVAAGGVSAFVFWIIVVRIGDHFLAAKPNFYKLEDRNV